MSFLNIPENADPGNVLDALDDIVTWLLTRGTQAEAMRQVEAGVPAATAIYNAAIKSGDVVTDMLTEIIESVLEAAPRVAADMSDDVSKALAEQSN